VPLISGVPRKELIIALHAYKQKIRKNPVMQMMANRLSNEDIAALAIYFEGLK
jgi:cytochrome c